VVPALSDAPAAQVLPLFRRVLGDALERTPVCVRRLHGGAARALYRGEVRVERGQSRLAKALAWATSLPPAGHGPVEVEIAARDGRERWVRRIGGREMRSRLWAFSDDGLLWEWLGAAVFGFALQVEDGAIVWRVDRVRALGLLPLPSRWFREVVCRESGEDGRYRFDVRAAMPGVGLLVHYRGWLEVS
jgi:Domain of unknown function (DUF4166)